MYPCARAGHLLVWPPGQGSLVEGRRGRTGMETSMDGQRFDQLIKSTATQRLTRLTVLRGLAAGAAALAGLAGTRESGPAKNRQAKERTVCVCGPDATVGSCRSKKVKADKAKKLAKKPCNYKGKCTGVNPCAGQTPTGQTPTGQTPTGQTPTDCTPTCEAGQVCANGQCVSSCPDGQKLCSGGCIPSNQCCTGSDCPATQPTCCRGTCYAAAELCG